MAWPASQESPWKWRTVTTGDVDAMALHTASGPLQSVKPFVGTQVSGFWSWPAGNAWLPVCVPAQLSSSKDVQDASVVDKHMDMWEPAADESGKHPGRRLADVCDGRGRP